MLLGTVVYGLVNSMMLVLLAVGFNFTFGVSGISNFAYGALYIISGFVIWTVLNIVGIPFGFAVVLTVLISGVIGGLLYRLVLLRVRGMDILEVIATFSIGVGLLELLRYCGFYGMKYSLPLWIEGSLFVGGIYISYQRLLVVAMGVVLTSFLWFFTHHTRLGLAFRGIAQEERTAMSLGMNSDRLGMMSMAFGSAYGAIAASVILPLGAMTIDGGYDVLINALAVCLVGGLGSTVGVIVAALLIGYCQAITVMFIGPSWSMIVSLLAIYIVLLVKPSGLFGKQKELEERV